MKNRVYFMFLVFLSVIGFAFATLNVTPESCEINKIITRDKFKKVNIDTFQIINGESSDLTALDADIINILSEHGYPGMFYYSLNNKRRERLIICTYNNEGEYLSIKLFTFNKCKVISSLTVAEESAWEHGYKRTISSFINDSTIQVVTFSGAKDFGNYKTWKRDTVSVTYFISKIGEIQKL